MFKLRLEKPPHDLLTIWVILYMHFSATPSPSSGY